MTAISSPNYRWRVGEIEITRVLEFRLRYSNRP